MSDALSLLLVDDNPDDRTLVLREIRRVIPDARVDEVGDAAALERLIEDGRSWDVAVTDYQLRWATGLDVFRLLRAAREGLPVIMFTASGNEELAVEALKQGIDDYITKAPKHYGRVPYAILACADRKRRREEAAAALAARQRSEALLKLALEAARMAPWEFDPRTRQLAVRPAFAGLTAEESARPVDALFDAMHPEDAQALIDAGRRALAEGARFEREFRMRIREQWRWLRVAGIRNVNGGLVGVVEDITERKRVEQQLLEADRQKDQFIATLGHELRNPLAPIRYALQLLAEPGEPAVVAHARAVITRQVDTMARLLDQLLDLSRIAQGRVHLSCSRIDLREVVQHAIEDARPTAHGAGQVLTATLPGEPAVVDGDAVRLKQVFDNLIQNAIKFTPEGGAIDVALTVDRGDAVVRVCDTGLGIPPDMLERVFEPLVQVNSGPGSATRGGLGIGLAVVRELVALHHGTVRASDRGPVQGTEFVVRLPLCDRDAAERPLADAGTTPGTEPLKVLVADDQPDAANTLGLVVRRLGHEVRTALDGLQARAIAESWRPDVMLLDIGMPGLSGDDLARWVREQPWGTQPRLVAVTGWGGEEDRLALQRAGFDAHLVKTAPIEQLLLELRRSL
ncbi:MAG TPA: response regulator [Lysobacter sp.]|nr:response regulator [Lysobacter sp.]